MLQASFKNSSNSMWCNNDATFHEPVCPEYEHVPGNTSFSPGWFQIGHSISTSYNLHQFSFHVQGRSSEYLPKVSSILKSGRTSDPGHQFLLNMSESFALMGATLVLIHPSLFAAGMNAMAKMAAGLVTCKEPDLVKEVMKLWPLPFNAFLVISNRQTVPHHDVQGMLLNYNLLTTFRSYNDGCFKVLAVSLRFVYNPGTLIRISGKILLHGVGVVSSDWICITSYFQEKVMERIGMHESESTTHKDFESCFINITKHK